MKLLLTFSLALIIGALTAYARSPVRPPERPSTDVEVLLGMIADSSGLTIQVDSGGCTDKESFEIEVFNYFIPEIRFVRVIQDLCEVYLRNGTTLHYTWQELGVAPVFNVNNPVRRRPISSY